jgi:hypothetical protein
MYYVYFSFSSNLIKSLDDVSQSYFLINMFDAINLPLNFTFLYPSDLTNTPCQSGSIHKYRNYTKYLKKKNVMWELDTQCLMLVS